MIRFLHIGDVHINKTFATKDNNTRDKLKKSLKKSFENAINYCIQKKLDGLIIAGDLLDTNSLSLYDKEFLIREFDKLNDNSINVYYASGNHDYTNETSDVRNINYPSNVFTFFDNSYNEYFLIDKDTSEKYRIVGIGHNSKKENNNLILNLPVCYENNTIGIAHTMVESRLTIGDEGNYLPSTIESLTSRNYIYFALGHIHKGGSIDLNNRIYYSGSLQGLSSKEDGIKGGYLVEISDGVSRAKLVELSSMKWKKVGLVIDSKVSNFEEVYDKLFVFINEVAKLENLGDLSLEINISGKTKLYSLLKDEKRISELIETLLDYVGLFDLKIKTNGLRTSFSKLDYIGKKSVLGSILDKVDEMSTYELSIDLDFLGLVNESNKQEYVKELLNEMDETIMNYFLEGSDED